MRVIAWDTETDRFRPGLMAPPVVCLQWAEVTPAGVGQAHVVDEAEGLRLMRGWLSDPEIHLVGAEISYDVLAMVQSATERANDNGLDPFCPTGGHALLSAFVAAYDANRISDVLVRQKLIDLARGCYGFERGHDDAAAGVNEYNLAGLAWRLCRIELAKGDDTWRKRYGELRGLPVAQWPRDAVMYAANDATATGATWLAQWKPSTRIALNFPGKTVSDALVDEFRQVQAALWLKAMSVWGLRTDPVALQIFSHYVAEDYAETIETLIHACEHCGTMPAEHSPQKLCPLPALPDGRVWLYKAAALARRDYHVSREAVVSYVFARPALLALASKGRTPSVKLGAVERAALAAADPTLACLVDPSARPDLSVAAGLVTITEHRNTKAATTRMIAHHRRAGTVVPMTKTGLRLAKGIGKDGKRIPKVDVNPEDYVALDKDACESTLDPLLEAYAEMTHLAKILSTDLPRLKDGALMPIHSHFEVLRETGRTSSAGPNVQNQARGRKDRIGARECFVPRAGMVLIDSDYSMLELHTLAQAQLWWFGRSALADELRKPGADPHTKVGAAIAGVSYEEGLRLKACKDPDFDNFRNCSKPLNFGKPGGLGAETMTAFAAKGYGVKRPQAFWANAIKTWEQTWPDMADYFRAINALEGYRKGRYNVVQPWSGRLRAGATYCSACNSIFQGLGADVAKLAGWLIFKACYVDRSSPLFGARTVLMIHDQFLTEIEEYRAAAGAKEIERLMNLAGSIVLPDVPVRAEPSLARRYSKHAKKMVDQNGNLTAWEDARLLEAA